MLLALPKGAARNKMDKTGSPSSMGGSQEVGGGPTGRRSPSGSPLCDENEGERPCVPPKSGVFSEGDGCAPEVTGARVERTFWETLRRYGMDRLMEERGTVIVGFSGGADSTVLLRLLASYASSRGVRLVCAHVNHGIRGEESDRDEAFARETATALGIPIYVRRVNVPLEAERLRCGWEEAARTLRYAFFHALSEQLASDDGRESALSRERPLSKEGREPLIATAHNADDNLETVLFHLLRGSGTRGLCGMDPVREERYLRPLIRCTGGELRAYCREHGIPYVEDSTNADIAYTRNYIRHVLVPCLARITPSPAESVLRMTELLRADRDYLEAQAESIRSPGASRLDRAVLRALSFAIASRVLVRWYAELQDSAGETENRTLGSVHVEAMLRLAASSNTEGEISLPGKIAFAVNRREVFFVREKERSRAKKTETEAEFCVKIDETGGIFENERYKMEISPVEHEKSTEEFENIYKLSIHQRVSFDKIIGALYIKYRKDGDTYQCGGMTRRVKKLLCEKKLTAGEKRQLPLLWDEAGLLWVPYYPVRDSGGPSSETEPCLHLYFYEKREPSETKQNFGGEGT